MSRVFAPKCPKSKAQQKNTLQTFLTKRKVSNFTNIKKKYFSCKFFGLACKILDKMDIFQKVLKSNELGSHSWDLVVD